MAGQHEENSRTPNRQGETDLAEDGHDEDVEEVQAPVGAEAGDVDGEPGDEEEAG